MARPDFLEEEEVVCSLSWSLHGSWKFPLNTVDSFVPAFLPEEGLLWPYMLGQGLGFVGVLLPSNLGGLCSVELGPWQSLPFPVDFVFLLRKSKVFCVKCKIGFLLECVRRASDYFVFHQ